jgi:hypothetical protein
LPYTIGIASLTLPLPTNPPLATAPPPYAWESFDVTHVPLRWLRMEDDSATGKRWKQWLGQAVGGLSLAYNRP